MKRQVLPLILCLSVTLLLFGCMAEPAPTGASTAASSTQTKGTRQSQAATSTQITSTTRQPETSVETSGDPTDPDYLQPVAFTWKPYVLSELYINLYGEAFVAEFKSMVKAFMAYETTFACSSVEQADAINTAASCCFPLLDMDVYRVEYDDKQNAGVLTYAWPEAEHEAGIRHFEKSVSQFITDCVMKTDDQVTAALALYMAYSQKITYDYAALADDSTADLSAYRGLTEFEGICQTFGPAYAYLCLQMGIDAISAGGLSTDDTAHEWTLVKLDGAYYYMDTTFENGDGGYGLKYFGMTAESRVSAGNYIAKTFNIGDTNEIWGNDIKADNERFAGLRAATYALLNRGLNQVECTGAEGRQWVFSLDGEQE